MTYAPAQDSRIRRKLDRMQHDDRREAARSTSGAMERDLRATLNAAHPNASPEEIERLVALVKSKWSKPTNAVVKQSPGNLNHVLAARRDARKDIVAKGREARRG